jgi:hypothetical protein
MGIVIGSACNRGAIKVFIEREVRMAQKWQEKVQEGTRGERAKERGSTEARKRYGSGNEQQSCKIRQGDEQ